MERNKKWIFIPAKFGVFTAIKTRVLILWALTPSSDVIGYLSYFAQISRLEEFGLLLTGHIKSLVYATKSQMLTEVTDRIFEAAAPIKK
jgi:hypothetical protein